MDMTVVAIGEVVVAALEDAGYMQSTIGQYRRTIRWLEVFSSRQDGIYSSELGAKFASMSTSPRTGAYSAARHFERGRLVWLFDSYVFTGAVDLSRRPYRRQRLAPCSADFVALLVAWDQDMAGRGLADSTQSRLGAFAGEYLLYLESGGFSSWQDADGASVLGFLQSLRSRLAESTMGSAVASVRSFLKFTGRTDLLDALVLARARRHHKIIPVLDSGVEQKVVDACRKGLVSARDAAITLLSLATGLRACDTCNLRLTDINWRVGTLGFVQQKTGDPLTLPLLPLVLSKLADYVLKERPASQAQEVFLKLIAPHNPLAGHSSIYVIVTKTFRMAGIGDVKVGTRALRYNAASSLLRAGTALPTIAAVLGHSDLDSTKVYLSMDNKRLRACVLAMPEVAGL